MRKERNMKQFVGNGLLKYFSTEELESISSIQNPEEKAKIIVDELFKDKFDKAGNPYVLHLYRVSSKLDTVIERTAGLLHDTFEDTEISYDDLLNIGFSAEVLDIVKIVTNEKVDTSSFIQAQKLEWYNKKIDTIIQSANIHAIKLKESDMSDNFNPERLKTLSVEEQNWFKKKYSTQLEKLREFINKQQKSNHN